MHNRRSYSILFFKICFKIYTFKTISKTPYALLKTNFVPMKKTLFLTGLILISSFMGVACSGSSGQTDTLPKPDFRVLGYLHSHSNLTTDFRKVDLSLITDLNIAFINPDEQGRFIPRPEYTHVLAEAHNKNVRVFFSIGGGSPPPHLEGLVATAEGRTKLVGGIVKLFDTYNFDGVDIDLENDLINEHYATFVYTAAKAVKAKNKLLTAALAKWNSDKIADSTLTKYDFINVMSYDATGPWNPDKAGPHSPYSMAVNDFNYFTGIRKIASDKILIGLPFYGYGFNGAPVSMNYKDIIKDYPGSELKDEINIGGGTLYYNGLPTIESKTKFAVDNGAAGVMIWQLLQDSRDEKSLLKAINNTANP